MNTHEPNYPGTVLVTADWCCHHSTDRCPTQEPHLIAQCGEFDPPRLTADPPVLGPWPRRSWLSYDTMRPRWAS